MTLLQENEKAPVNNRAPLLIKNRKTLRKRWRLPNNRRAVILRPKSLCLHQPLLHLRPYGTVGKTGNTQNLNGLKAPSDQFKTN